MPIRIQIVTQKWNFISAAIRYSTRSWASHCEFVNVAEGTTLGSRAKGGVEVRYSAKDKYSKVEQFTAANITRAYAWALTQVGKPYDFSAITGMVVNRDWHDEAKWFCSELLVVAFEQVGSPILSTRPSAKVWRITPRDLLLSRLLYFLPEGDNHGL